MTPDFKRGLAIGFVLALVLCVAGLAIHDKRLTAAIELQDRESDRLTRERIAQRRRADSLQADLRAASARADHLARRAEAIANSYGRIQNAITVLKPAEPIGGDTVKHVFVKRPGDPMEYRVPAFVMEDRAAVLAMVLDIKMAWEAERSARLQAVNVVIPQLLEQLATADSLAESRRKAIEMRDAVAKPRCGRRCGIAIGIGSVVLAGFALGKARVVMPQ